MVATCSIIPSRAGRWKATASAVDSLGNPLEAGTTVALANKEPLVVAGELIMEAARRGSAELLPLDSELSAIHQCLRGNEAAEVGRKTFTGYYSTSRTCELGLSRATGRPYRSLWRLLDLSTR